MRSSSPDSCIGGGDREDDGCRLNWLVDPEECVGGGAAEGVARWGKTTDAGEESALLYPCDA